MPDEPPIAVLLLPRQLERFILRDQAEDLLRAPGVVALEPGRVPYAVLGRFPWFLADFLAVGNIRRLKLPGTPVAAIMFHPLQLPVARALQARHSGCEIWYARWDRYEDAYDARPRLRRRLAELHEDAAQRAALTFAASGRLVELEREEGRDAELAPPAADSFPAPDPGTAIVAVCLGHHGRRTDWGLLRAVAEGMPDLTVLLVGEWHDDEVGGDEDYRACRALPNLVWLGRRSDEEAARIALCADAGILPFKDEPFNDAGLPVRILKCARLGRRTVTPELAGVLTWERAVIRAATPAEWVAALRSLAGTRTAPDAELREWALAQTAEESNAVLWERLEELGVDIA